MLPKSSGKKRENTNLTNYLSKIDDEDVKAEIAALSGLDYNLYATKDNIDTINFSVVKKQSKMPLKESLTKREKYSDPQDQHGKGKEPQIAYLSSNTSISEIRKIIRQQAKTSEDRYKVLEARDRLMRLKRAKIHTLETAKVTVGTCPDMCPEKERLMREFQRQVAAYEFLDSGEYKINHEFAIKQYSRSSADQEEPLPQDLRPVSSLKMTMSYLLHEIADLCEEESTNLGEWYHFLWDRTRGIRKDITQQELCCPDSVELIEQCARFHIVCSERLCAEELSVFDKKINTENLTKCLQTLKYMYHDLRLKEISCKNEPEFRGYIILLNLNDANFMWDLQKLPKNVQKSPEVAFALKVYFAVQSNNYAKFFRLVKETTYLNACILLRYFFQVRSKALSVMVKAYCRTTSTAYPLYELIEILGFEDENEAINFCEQAGFNLSNDELHIVLNRQNAILPPPMINQERARTLVESKRIQSGNSIGKVISGGQMSEKLYLNHIPHNSFDDQGYLKMESINASDQNGEAETDDGPDMEQDPYEFMEEEEEEETEDVEFNEEMVEEEEEVNEMIDEEERDEEIDENNEIDQPELETKKLPNFSFSKPTSFNFSKTSKDNQGNSIFSCKNRQSNSNNQINIFSKPIASNLNQNSDFKTSNCLFSSSENINKSVFKLPSPVSGIFGKNEPQKTIFGGQEKPKKEDSSFLFNAPQPSVFQKPLTPPKVDNSSVPEFQFKVPEPLKSRKSVSPVKRTLEDPNKKQKELETSEKRRKELSLLEQEEIVDKETTKIADELISDIVHDVCLTILKEEWEKIKVYDTISDKLLNDLLNEMIAEESKICFNDELEMQRKLKEISQKKKNKMTIKYYKMWRQRIDKIKQQRKALENTPVWLPKYSLEDSAKNLYSKQQEVVLKNMKGGLIRLKNPEDSDSNRTYLIPVECQIYKGLKRNYKSLNAGSPAMIFWKMIVSWPNLDNRILLRRHRKIMSEYFSPKISTTSPIIKVYKPNPYETLNICINHCEGEVDDKEITSGMDGLLFIATADEDFRSVSRRLTKLVLSRQKLMSVPLLMIILGDTTGNSVEPTAELENLVDAGYLSQFTVHYEKTIDESVILKLTQTGVLWLALNKSPSIPLEMDRLRDVIADCLTDELWLRMSGHAVYNDNLAAALEDPNFIINMHNEAVSLLSDQLIEPENLMYTDFPLEFKRFLPRSVNLPYTYEYFDEDWKKEETRVQIERIVNSFSLPDWSFEWPVNNTMELHKYIIRYSQLVLKETNYPEISSNIISKIFFMSNDQKIPNFVHIIMEIIKEKLADVSKDITVVYNKNHIKHFKTLPWWFKTDYLIKYDANKRINSINTTKMLLRNTIEEPLIKKRRIAEENAEISKIIQNYSNIFDDEPVDYDCVDEENALDEIKRTSKTLEKILLEQKLSNSLYEEKLKLALEC